MAVTCTLSNHCKYMLMTKAIDFANDTFKVILLNTTFAFDKDAHATLADVTASQLSTGNGYTQDNKTIANVSVTEDDTNDKGTASWDDVTWTAASGDIGPMGAAIVYDETTSDDTVIGCIDFGADYLIPDGSSLQLTNISFDLP